MEKINQFSNNKIFFHKTKLRQVLNAQIIAPVVYEISLSGNCNCQCEYCCCRDYHSNQMLSIEDIDILGEQLKRNSAKAITITGGGEPLTNPNFEYCVKTMNRHGLSVGIITNGLLLNQKVIETIVKYTSFIRISLDTVNPANYIKLRGTFFDKKGVSENLKLLSKCKNELVSPILIGTQIVYINQAIADIEETIIFSKKANVDFLQIRPMDNIPGEELFRNYEFYKAHKCALECLALKYSDEKFKVILNENKFEEYYGDNVSKEYENCLGANFTASIGHDMNLYFCCSHIGNPLFSLGSLRQESLKSLLFSEKRKLLIENPCFRFCQMQCRNHKLNKILYKLKNMKIDELKELMDEKEKGELPQHYEFL